MADQLNHHEFLHHAWAGALTITTLCAQYSAVLMTSNSNSKAQWNEEETTALLLYLDGRKYETEGIGNF
ncbi:hypothetical protein BYT27DRAFT_7095205, partial [Phlegmacium glaucopus]